MALGAIVSLAGAESTTEGNMKTLLFFDDEALNQRQNIVRRIGRAERIEESVFADPSGGNAAWGYPFVWRDTTSGKWRMIYQAGHYKNTYRDCGGGVVMLAESADGLRWQAVDTTAAVKLPDRVTINQVLPMTKGVGLLSGGYEDTRAEPDRRLKLMRVVCGAAPNGSELWTSADGLSWRLEEGVHWQTQAPDPPTFAHFNALRGRYVLSSRPDNGQRQIVLFETDDWRTFTPPEELVMTADSLDRPLTQIYGMPIFPYEGWYIGLVWLFHCPASERRHFPHIYLGGRSDVQVAYSRNGWHWQRGPREPLLPNGANGAPDAGCLQASSMVRLEDGSLRIYACTSRHEHGQIHSGDGYIVAYALRQDGFVCLQSDGGPGWVGTRALYWRGGEARLNVQARGGWARVQVTDPRGRTLDGYSFDACAKFDGDRADWTPEWKDGCTLAALAGRPVRLEIELYNASLYALRGDFVVLNTEQVKKFNEKGIIPGDRPGF